MSNKNDFSDIMADFDILDGQADAWTVVYGELTKTGTRVTLPFGVDTISINEALGIIRTLQAKAAAFDSLCEKPPQFTKPDASDFNSRMFQEGANRVHGLAMELKTIADHTLDEYADSDWRKAPRRHLH